LNAGFSSPRVDGLVEKTGMPCPHCVAVESTFGNRAAERRRQRTNARGLEQTTLWLIESLEAEGVDGASLMDIGCGLGGVGLRLLRAGAEKAVLVEASTAFLEAARDEAAEQGFEDRIAWHHGDFVELAPTLADADIVCLDRVICCYPDMPSLVGLSAARAGRLYGLVFPRRTWWTRLGAWAINLTLWLGRSAFRVFVHRPGAIERIAGRHGLEPVFRRRNLIWQVIVFRRTGPVEPFAQPPAAG
jgi:SAM-dependent methyltransferase